MDPERLAELLAEAFTAIVPPGFWVMPDDGMLLYLSPGGHSGASSVRGSLDNGDTMEERIAWRAEEMLGQLQDFVDEESREPWPGDRIVPDYHAEVRGSKLFLWFGDADAPVLQCEPIEII